MVTRAPWAPICSKQRRLVRAGTVAHPNHSPDFPRYLWLPLFSGTAQRRALRCCCSYISASLEFVTTGAIGVGKPSYLLLANARSRRISSHATYCSGGSLSKKSQTTARLVAVTEPKRITDCVLPGSTYTSSPWETTRAGSWQTYHCGCS